MGVLIVYFHMTIFFFDRFFLVTFYMTYVKNVYKKFEFIIILSDSFYLSLLLYSLMKGLPSTCPI